MQKITPFLWFNNQAEEAMNFYLSIFKNSKKFSVTHYSDAGPGEDGNVTVAEFQIENQIFTAINGGPLFKFSPAISFVVNCESQEEVDHYWEKLSEDGEQQQCGWLIDKFGVSWQIVPVILNKLMSDPDPVKSKRVMKAMLKMIKIDIEELYKAYNEI